MFVTRFVINPNRGVEYSGETRVKNEINDGNITNALTRDSYTDDCQGPQTSPQYLRFLLKDK